MTSDKIKPMRRVQKGVYETANQKFHIITWRKYGEWHVYKRTLTGWKYIASFPTLKLAIERLKNDNNK